MTIGPSNSIQLGGISTKPFSGIITDLNVWSRPLNGKEQEGFHFCKPETIASKPNSVNWDKLSILSKGVSVKENDIIVYELCPNSKEIKDRIRNEPTKFFT